MNTPDRFNRAIAALVKSYLHGTLAPGHCHACAVGNMVADACDYAITPIKSNTDYFWTSMDGEKPYPYWDEVFITTGAQQAIDVSMYRGRAMEQIDSTGYSWKELAKVEYAFERNTKISHAEYDERTPEEIDSDQYNGLVAVFNTLCEIEGITDPAPYVQLLTKEVSY